MTETATSDNDRYAVKRISIPADQAAMFLINGAYRFASIKMTFVEDAIYALRIQDAVREGKKTAEDIAWRALELEGWRPKWVDAGGISYIGIDPP